MRISKFSDGESPFAVGEQSFPVGEPRFFDGEWIISQMGLLPLKAEAKIQHFWMKCKSLFLYGRDFGGFQLPQAQQNRPERPESPQPRATPWGVVRQ